MKSRENFSQIFYSYNSRPKNASNETNQFHGIFLYKKKIREIDLFDFTSFFGLDFFNFSVINDEPIALGSAV